MLKRIKPCTPGQRHVVRMKVDTEGGVQWVPLSLRAGKRQKSGRNNRGRITVRHRGGGKKRLLRTLRGGKNQGRTGRAKVIGIQYDPNRTARLALVQGVDNPAYGYVLAAEGLKVGSVVQVGGAGKAERGDQGQEKSTREKNWSRMGSTRKLESIPVGMTVFNLELEPGKGGKYVRTAGAGARLLRKPEGKALLRLPSGTRVEVSLECTATVGRVAGEEHRMEVMGKAGRMRNKGWRPTVRGEAMNPVDHPHGGRTRGGRPEVTPWARIAKGKPTRSKKKTSRWVVSGDTRG
jgi:large subunit ribosomal protein L2